MKKAQRAQTQVEYLIILCVVAIISLLIMWGVNTSINGRIHQVAEACKVSDAYYKEMKQKDADAAGKEFSVWFEEEYQKRKEGKPNSLLLVTSLPDAQPSTTTIKEFTCSSCGKKFTADDVREIVYVPAINSVRIICPHCNKKLTSVFNLVEQKQ